MKLKYIELKNFRSFGEIKQRIEFNKFTTLIGGNSVGKTSVLSALKIMFSNKAKERILKRSDFHIPKEENVETFLKQELQIEAVFEFDELDESESHNKDAIPLFFESFVIEDPDSLPILRIRLEATWEYDGTEEGSIESSYYFIKAPTEVSEKIVDSNKFKASRHDLNNIRLIYIPAVRNPSSQLKNISGSLINQVMSNVRWDDETKEEIVKSIDTLNDVFASASGVKIIKDSISSKWKEYHADKRYSNAVLNFNSTSIEQVLRRIEILFSPTESGRDYEIDEMGDGLRSLFYFSLVDSILEVEKHIRITHSVENKSYFINQPPVFTILAIEEPENHISPYKLGELVNLLKEISLGGSAQSILTSHSPSIVKRIEPENIRHLRIDLNTLSTLVSRLDLPDSESETDQYKYVKEAVKAYPELYFSRLVIFGEGDSEELILSKMLDFADINVDSSSIGIVPLGGRHVNHFWRLVSSLEIPHITLLDLDMERNTGGWSRIKYVLKQLEMNGKLMIDKISLENDKLFSIDELNLMHTYPLKTENDKKMLYSWIDFLKHYNVYFSSPLDIDFMMLESYLEKYIETLQDNEGPRIKINGEDTSKKISLLTSEDKETEAFKIRLMNDVKTTLKSQENTGFNYTDEQKELMIWYNYFFLSRGKPSTHLSFLSNIEKKEFNSNLPCVFKEIVSNIKTKLNVER